MIKPVLKPQQPTKRNILSVSQLNSQVKSVLEEKLGSVWICGEISNLIKAVSGHWYFTLKDDNAQIRCAMFRFKTQNLRFAPSEGDKVIVKGKVSLYESRGDYQLIADFMEPDGLGNLQQQLNQLIESLNAQGLFSQVNKKPLPKFPERIGVITSPTGAAIRDVLNVLNRRCPMVPVVIYPTQVQGKQATLQILEALKTAQKRAECDVLLMTRGGGSLEDLWCFNEERLARAIADCNIPLVAAIGHEVDTTIAELVADLRAPTPSAAAELLVPDQLTLAQTIDNQFNALIEKINIQFEAKQSRLEKARLTLANPSTAIKQSQINLEKLYAKMQISLLQRLQNERSQFENLTRQLTRLDPSVNLKVAQQRLTHLNGKLESAWQNQLTRLTQRFHIAIGALETLSPLSTLSRGYAIAREPNRGKVISHIEKLSPGKAFQLQLVDGSAECEVKKTERNL